MTSKIYLAEAWTEIATGACLIEAQGKIEITFAASAPPVDAPGHDLVSGEDPLNYAGNDKAWARAIQTGSAVIVSGSVERPSQGPIPRVVGRGYPPHQFSVTLNTEYSISDLAEVFSVSRPTIYRTLLRIGIKIRS